MNGYNVASPMRVCILTDETIDTYNPAELLGAYEWEVATVEHPVDEFIRKLASAGKYDVYLNIFDGEADDDAGLVAVKTMEELNLPFTGANVGFYNPTREQMQVIAERNGISFARGFNAKTEADLHQAKNLRFPLIVKHPNSFASEGLTHQSRVESFEALREQFMRNKNEYGSARVEEFIDGREITCLVVDNPDDLTQPFAYHPAEVIFPEGENFLHVEVKWFNWGTFFVPLEDQNLTAMAQEASRRMFLAMSGTGYCRVDYRIRPDGELVMLEINPNCGILYYGSDDRSPADLPISWDKDGHNGFLDRIFRSAILHQQMRL